MDYSNNTKHLVKYSRVLTVALIILTIPILISTKIGKSSKIDTTRKPTKYDKGADDIKVSFTHNANIMFAYTPHRPSTVSCQGARLAAEASKVPTCLNPLKVSTFTYLLIYYNCFFRNAYSKYCTMLNMEIVT